MPSVIRLRVEDSDHRGPKDRATVIEHINDSQRDAGSGEVSAPSIRKYFGRGKWMLCLSVSFPESEEHEHDASDDQRGDNMRIGAGEDRCVDDADEEWEGSGEEQENADIIQLPQDLHVRQTQWVRRWIVEEVQAQEGSELQYGARDEVTTPATDIVAITSRNRNNGNAGINGSICKDDADMSPFVGKQLGQGESSHLAKGSTGAGHGHACNYHPVRLRCCENDVANAADQVTDDKEPAATEKISVRAAPVRVRRG